MLNTLEKLKNLEIYLTANNANLDLVLDRTITKLLLREQSRIQHIVVRLRQEIEQFEHLYQMSSQEFYTKYNQGNMGDAMDFIEWAATIEMLANTERHIALLDVA